MSNKYDIIVVGGGAAGLFATLALKDAGFTIALVAPPSTHDQRTTALMMPAITALAKLGVEVRSTPLKAMCLIDATGSVIRAPETCFRAEELGLEQFGFNIENNDLIAELEAKILDVPRFNSPLQAKDEAGITLEDGTLLQAKLYVGADGKASKLRELVGLETLKKPYNQVALTLNFTHSRPHNNESVEFHTSEGPLTLVPLQGNRSSLVWVMSKEKGARLKDLSDESLAKALSQTTNNLYGAIEITSKRGLFPLSLETPKALVKDDVALVGEAAHVLPPIGAQGLNLGLRDGAFLRDAALKYGVENCLLPYASSRRADILIRNLAVDGLNSSLLSAFLPAHALRAGGLWALDKIPFLRKKAMQGGLAPSNLPELMKV